MLASVALAFTALEIQPNRGANMKISQSALAVLVFAVSAAHAAPEAQMAPQGSTQMPGMSHDMSNMKSMDKSDMHSMHMSSSPNAAKAATELQFLETMPMHHKMAIDMANLVESRAAHAELKALAKKMIEDQQKETAELKGWREQWYAGKPEAMNMKMTGMSDSMKGMSMEKLAAAKGEAFDLMFIDMMSQHHSGAIRMAQTAGPKLQHAEVKDFAKKLAAGQKEELAQMKDWKKSWGSTKH